MPPPPPPVGRTDCLKQDYENVLHPLRMCTLDLISSINNKWKRKAKSPSFVHNSSLGFQGLIASAN